eukprot:scaffold190090_cov26-Tisochrysis_lutea.AAC.1
MPEGCGLFFEKETQTGGIGEHVRMEVLFPNAAKPSEPTELVIVCDGEDADERMTRLVAEMGDRMAFKERRCDGRFMDFKGHGRVAVVIVKKRVNLTFAMAFFAWNGVKADCFDENAARIVTYLPDKMSRRNWGDNDPVHAGPSRDAWRWRLNQNPPTWPVVYTMQGYAHFISPSHSAGLSTL